MMIGFEIKPFFCQGFAKAIKGYFLVKIGTAIKTLHVPHFVEDWFRNAAAKLARNCLSIS